MQIIFTTVEIYKLIYLSPLIMDIALHAQMLCDIDPSHQLHNYT